MTFLSAALWKGNRSKLADSGYFRGTTGIGNSISTFAKKQIKRRVNDNCSMPQTYQLNDDWLATLKKGGGVFYKKLEF